MRILYVQYAGDFREAYVDAFERDAETYHGHRYAIESLSQLGTEFGVAGVLCCRTDEIYDDVLPTGLRVLGAGADPYHDLSRVLRAITAFGPTHVVVGVPVPGLVNWAAEHRVRTLAMLQDSFEGRGVRNTWRHRSLARALNRSEVDWVGNHNVNSCMSAARIGVSVHKLVPWDWPHTTSPTDLPAKDLRPEGVKRLQYVGHVSEAKGVGDVIAALAQLRRQGTEVAFSVAGDGDVAQMSALSERLGVQDLVEFVGRIPHRRVVALMHEADAVVVPSRHEYPEGLPLTIYEGLSSRSPLIVSDHPMFAGKLEHGTSALVHGAGKPALIAQRIEELFGDPLLYGRLSRAAPEAHQGLQVQVLWGDLIRRWVAGAPADATWIAERNLVSGLYDLS